jgi:hypothetical protein
MTLLDQHVDEFDLYAVKDKIVVILNWKFSFTLKTLKIYIEFIEWFRNYVSWYAQKIESLQQRKTLLLKKSSHKESARKTYFMRIILKKSIKRELKSFELIQNAFKNSRFFTHFNLIRQFLIDVNVSKDDFEIFVYHIKKKRDDMTKFTIIELIVFLSKTLTFVEKRYWSTELKIAAVVWMIKKLHHMIRASRHLTIIWTNHSTIASIVKQIKMSISNIDKLNLRLVRVEMYLSQFDLNIRHKSNRDHIISNALSRLFSFDNEEKFRKNLDVDTLNDIKTYVETLIKMFSAFKDKQIQTYKIDREWFVIYVMLTILKTSKVQSIRWDIVSIKINIRKLSKNALIEQYSSTQKTHSENFTHVEIEFELRNELIYHLNRVTFKARLCISKSLIQSIFKMTYDDLAHVEFHRAYILIFETLYIRRLAHHLRQYIEYFSTCLLNQIKRHKSYDALILISSSKISFHIITMNFVLILS